MLQAFADAWGDQRPPRRVAIRSCISHRGPECANAFSFSVPAPSLGTCLIFAAFPNHMTEQGFLAKLAAGLVSFVRPRIRATPAQVPASTGRPAGLAPLPNFGSDGRSQPAVHLLFPSVSGGGTWHRGDEFLAELRRGRFRGDRLQDRVCHSNTRKASYLCLKCKMCV